MSRRDRKFGYCCPGISGDGGTPPLFGGSLADQLFWLFRFLAFSMDIALTGSVRGAAGLARV
jgi:hypothetical protein